jgi:hypothetical protein
MVDDFAATVAEAAVACFAWQANRLTQRLT